MVQFPDCDIAAVARSMGARGITVRQQSDLSELQEWVDEGCPGVMVIDAKITPSLEANWHADAYAV